MKKWSALYHSRIFVSQKYLFINKVEKTQWNQNQEEIQKKENYDKMNVGLQYRGGFAIFLWNESFHQLISTHIAQELDEVISGTET